MLPANTVDGLSEACMHDGPYSAACQHPGERQHETPGAFFCLDGLNNWESGKASFDKFRQQLAKQNFVLGDWMAEWSLMCAGREIKPEGRFDGIATLCVK